MISAQEAKEEIEKIQQMITIQLQGIDRNFYQCNEILGKRILPDITQYGVHTSNIIAASEMWYRFFYAIEETKSGVDPSISDTTSYTNRPPLHDHTRDSTSVNSRTAAWNRRKRSFESTPESKISFRKKTFPHLATILSDASSSTNQTDQLLYSPPRTIPFGVSYNKIANTPIHEQAKIISENNMRAMSIGFTDSDPSEELQPPQLRSTEQTRRRIYHDPRVFSSAERIEQVMNRPSIVSKGFASPVNTTTRHTPIFRIPTTYNANSNNNNNNSSHNNNNSNNNNNSSSRRSNSIIRDNYNDNFNSSYNASRHSNSISSNSHNNNNNNNINDISSSSVNNNNSRSSNNDNNGNNNTWNENILNKENPAEREKFEEFFLKRQRKSADFNDELPIYRNLISSPTNPDHLRGAVPQPLVGSPTMLRVFDQKETDLRRLMSIRERETFTERRILEGNSDSENDVPIMEAIETPERSTRSRRGFESPIILQDDSPMRITQEVDRFSPMRVNNMEDFQQTPEAVPLFSQNLTYEASPMGYSSVTSNDSLSNITMIRGEYDSNIPAKFSLKYFPDQFRNPPGSQQLTQVFNLFSDRPGEMLTLDDVLRLLNDKSCIPDQVLLLINVLKGRKYLKRVGDGQAWTIRR